MKPIHILFGVFIAFLWASEWVVAKAIIHDVPSFFLNCIRFAIVSLIFSSYLRKPIPCPWKTPALISLLYIVVHFGLVFLGMQWGLDAASTIVIAQVGVPLSALLGILVFKHKPHFSTFVGIAFALGGLCVVFGSPNIKSAPLGFLCVLTGVLSWSIGNILIARLPTNIPSLQLLFWFALFSIIPLGVISLFVDPSWVSLIGNMGWHQWLAIFYIAAITTSVGDSGWYWLLQRYPTHFVAPFMLLAPLFGSVLSSIFLGETLTSSMLIGASFIVGGVAFTFLSYRTKTILPAD